nr:alpha/beta hydrolase [Paracoccus sp. Z118]
MHCMMGTSSYWRPIADRLGSRIDLRGFDMPGHGRSPAWEAQPGVDFHTAVTRIAAGMIDRPLDLIGHSIGATVALRIAVGAPEAVRSLTLIEPVLFAALPSDHPERDARVALLRALIAEGRSMDAVAGFLDRWGGAGGLPAMPKTVHPTLARQIELVLDSNDALAHDTARILRDGGLEAIDAPVMLIAGSDSPPEMALIVDALAERLADVGRATVPGASHMLPLTHPAEVAGLIAANLDRA